MSNEIGMYPHPRTPGVWSSVGVGLKFLFTPKGYYLKVMMVLGLCVTASALLCAYVNPAWGFLTGFVGLLLWGGVNARLTRYVTLGEENANIAGPLCRGYFWLSIVADVVQAVLAYLALVPGLIVFMIGGGALGVAFTQPSFDAFVGSNPSLGVLTVLFFVLSFLLIFIPCYFVALRTLYLSTHVTAQRGFDIETTYKMTKGKVWRLLGLVLLMRCVIPAIIFGGLAIVLAVTLGMSFSALFQPREALDAQILHHLGAPHYVTYMIHVGLYLVMLIHGTWVVASAHYYQGLYEAHKAKEPDAKG